MTRVVAIVQCRMTSTRLPGKVLMPLCGAPMLERMLERVGTARRLDATWVATTINATDDPVVDLCSRLGYPCHRGSEHDVLSRFAETSGRSSADAVVRLTADCPLIDPGLIDQAVDRYLQGDCDYVSNMHPPTWPYGMAVEVFSAAALHEAQAEATLDAEREHVTPFIYWRPDRYRIANVALEEDLSHHRWTVDTPEDYDLVSRLFEAVYPSHPCFTLNDTLAAMAQHPQWREINQHVSQRQAGLQA
jgi:spore coat polysaccharide biosynthesis protein SpsF